MNADRVCAVCGTGRCNHSSHPFVSPNADRCAYKLPGEWRGQIMVASCGLTEAEHVGLPYYHRFVAPSGRSVIETIAEYERANPGALDKAEAELIAEGQLPAEVTEQTADRLLTAAEHKYAETVADELIARSRDQKTRAVAIAYRDLRRREREVAQINADSARRGGDAQ